MEQLFAGLPALSIVGPRATGKTTVARRLSRSVVALDDPVQARAFEADPDAALTALPEPVLLDEWQAVPEVLGAVKRAVDRGSGAGRVNGHRVLPTGGHRFSPVAAIFFSPLVAIGSPRWSGGVLRVLDVAEA